MKLFALMLALLAVLTTSAWADIIGWTCQDDHDGALVMGTPGWSENADVYTMTAPCKQYWGPGNIEGDFTTDTPTDPNVWILENVENDTTFAWTGYQFQIQMTKAFSITAVQTPDISWGDTITQPVLTAGVWIGEVDYAGGAPIAIGDSATFGLKVNFSGSTSYYTTQTPVPEPAITGMLALGSLLALRRKR